MRILIVEDNAYKLRTIQNQLSIDKEIKYDVASCAIEAFMHFEESQYDLIILDLGFCRNKQDQSSYEGKMGLELYENLKLEAKRRKRNLPDIIIFSETKLTEDEKDGIFGKASTDYEFAELFRKWYNSEVKALIVEDDFQKQIIVQDVLSRIKKIESYKATSAEQAIKIFKKSNNITLVILDMSFPWNCNDKSNGINVVRLIEKMQEICISQKRSMPKIVIYSIIPFEDLMLRAGKQIPESFCGQTFHQRGLEEILKEII